MKMALHSTNFRAIISKMDDKTLLVKNALFWFEDSDVSVEKINECFSLLLSDFQRLRKNSSFDAFLKAFDI